MNLTELAVFLLGALGMNHPNSDALLIARSMAEAVEVDTQEPITGTKEGDVSLGMTFAFYESSFRVTDKSGKCVEGDGGRALGPWQFQHVAASIACNPGLAARRWLVMAHSSAVRCADLPVDAQLAALASGNCSHGLLVSVARVKRARQVLDEVNGR